MTMTLKASDTSATVVLPRTLRAEIQAITDETGAPFAAITRMALKAYVAQHKEKMLEAEVEQQAA